MNLRSYTYLNMNMLNADDILFRRTKLGIQFNSEEIRNKINSIIKDHLN